MADDVTVAGFSGFRGLVMTGDGKITVSQGDADYSRIQNTCFYADIEVPSGVNAETYDAADICADMKVDGYIRFLAFMKFRADLYAKSSSAKRDTPWDSGDLNMSGNYIWFYAPCGSDGVTGTWNQTVGSPYLFPVSVAGDVNVADGGTLEIAVADDGSVVPLGISGRLTLAGGGTALLTGAVSEIRNGLWPLAGDVSVSGFWSVENADGSRQRKVVQLLETDGALYLKVDPRGFILNVR